MNPTVFRALLAMDSYNRGYGAGVRITPAGTSPINTGIGTATILNDSTEAIGLGVTSDVGFYATAYSWNGQTVISYRGTNTTSIQTEAGFFALPNWDDVFNGWSLGAGSAGASQGQLALQFYRAVAGLAKSAAEWISGQEKLPRQFSSL